MKVKDVVIDQYINYCLRYSLGVVYTESIGLLNILCRSTAFFLTEHYTVAGI